jgi:hypothetical protein
MEQELADVPEAVLERGSLGCACRRKGVRVDLDEREMSEGEADTPVEALPAAVMVITAPP